SRTFIKKSELDLNNISFQLDKNEVTVQSGNSSNMVFNFDKIIAYLSTFYTLKTGDLIYTGTPAGIGKIIAGDKLKGFIGDIEMLNVIIK
ncbi:fumarylacetoacetate hydrolase family protein, partial [Flavobacteriales bacterium]|nr:fumarylacetoacetate hydrolase family protein [Flavobacteriales bacterium]